MELEIKGVGYKLRSLRKELGLKQEDLVKHKINTSSKDTPFTRNLVSMVETDKSPLTKKLAETIHKNILIACDEMNIEATFDFEEVCITPAEQTIRYINDYKKSLCTVLSLNESLNYAEKLIALSEEYSLLNELSYLYITLGNLCYDNNLELSLKYFSSAHTLKANLEEDDRIDLIRKLKNIYIRLEKPTEALGLKFNESSNKTDIVEKCIFNDILCLKKLARLDKAISKIDYLKSILNNNSKNLSVKLQMLEANIHHEQNNLLKSLKIYRSLLSKKCTPDNKLFIQCNLLKLKIESSICTVDEIDNFTEDFPPENLTSHQLSLYYSTLIDGYDSLNEKKSLQFIVLALNKILDEPKHSSSSIKFFNIFLNKIMDSESKLDLFENEYKEDLKLLIVSSIKKKLIDDKTLFKVLLHFQNKHDYSFVNSLMKKKIS